MIIICGCLVILVATAIAIVRSKKPMDLIIAEAKYEMIYNAMGSRALLQDWMMRGSNKTGKQGITTYFYDFQNSYVQ